jgi:hypothetical protein
MILKPSFEIGIHCLVDEPFIGALANRLNPVVSDALFGAQIGQNRDGDAFAGR